MAEIEQRFISYKVPDHIIEEVKDYLRKMNNPTISREEWGELLEWIDKKKKEDDNYYLALLELTLSDERKRNVSDPENPVHKMNELRRKLSEK